MIWPWQKSLETGLIGTFCDGGHESSGACRTTEWLRTLLPNVAYLTLDDHTIPSNFWLHYASLNSADSCLCRVNIVHELYAVNWKLLWKNRAWLSLGRCESIYLEILRKTTQNMRQYCKSLGWDQNRKFLSSYRFPCSTRWSTKLTRVFVVFLSISGKILQENLKNVTVVSFHTVNDS